MTVTKTYEKIFQTIAQLIPQNQLVQTIIILVKASVEYGPHYASNLVK